MGEKPTDKPTDRILLDKVVSHVANNQIEEAKIYLEKIVEEHPKNIMARCYLSYCNLFKLIETNISEILEGNFVGVNVQQEYLEEIKALRKQDRPAAFAQAERFYSSATRSVEKKQIPRYLLFRMMAYLFDPFNPDYCIGLGIVFYDLSQNKAVPLYFYHQAAKLDPDSKYAFQFSADCYEALGQTGLVKTLREAAKEKKEKPLYERLDVEALRTYFTEQEEQYFKEGFEFFPNRIRAPVDWDLE